MVEHLSPADRLQADLAHLAQEMTKLSHAAHPAGSAALQYARQEFRELEATFKTKVQQLAALGERPNIVGLSQQVARAGERLDWSAARQPAKPVPSAAGGARYVAEVPVVHYMVPAFYKALDEWGAAVVSERPSLGCKGEVFETVYYTISLETVNDMFMIGEFMVLNHYADKPEGGPRG